MQNEAIASEVCARFHAELRKVDRIASTFREDARTATSAGAPPAKSATRRVVSYSAALSDSATIRTSAEHLDLATVIKVASAVTTETVLDRLIESLMLYCD